MDMDGIAVGMRNVAAARPPHRLSFDSCRHHAPDIDVGPASGPRPSRLSMMIAQMPTGRAAGHCRCRYAPLPRPPFCGLAGLSADSCV